MAGPNGSGKSTLVEEILGNVTGLPFVNTDVIAAHDWPGNPAAHAYDASRAAASERDRLLTEGASFITETVFSHPSKLELVQAANRVGYLLHLHVIAIPVNLCVARVAERVVAGGHDVPEEKIRQRYDRLWDLIVQARAVADETTFYDNSQAAMPFRVIAQFEKGTLVGDAQWPSWAPAILAGG